MTSDRTMRERLSPVLADDVSSLAEVQAAAMLMERALGVMVTPPYQALARAAAWMQRTLQRSNGSDAATQEVIRHLKAVQSAVVHRRTAAAFDTQGMRKELRRVSAALQPEAAKHAKRLTSALSGVLVEAEEVSAQPETAIEVTPVRDEPEKKTGDIEIEGVAQEALAEFVPKVILAEVPEEEWASEVTVPAFRRAN